MKEGPQRKGKMNPLANCCKVRWTLLTWKAGKDVSGGLGLFSVVTVRVSEDVRGSPSHGRGTKIEQ